MHVVENRNPKSFGKCVQLACAAGLLLTIGKSASAALLAPGATIYPTGTADGFAYPSAGETYLTTIDSPVEQYNVSIGSGVVYDLHFEIVTTIYQSPAGTIDFVYQLDNTSVNSGQTDYGDSINRLTLQSFAGYTVYADELAGSGYASAVSVDRSGDGSVVGYNFQGNNSSGTFIYTALTPGETSDDLVVRTDATSWGYGTASVIGGLNGDVTVQVPYGSVGSESVPEPASFGLASVAGLSLLGRRRRAVR